MADQKLTYSIEGDASGLKKAMAESEAAYRKLTDALARKVGEVGAFKSSQVELARLAAPVLVLHGTTLATNALIERRGATTVLVCFNPYLTIPRRLQPAVVIAPNLGPELLTGSTRLKAGTAASVILSHSAMASGWPQ